MHYKNNTVRYLQYLEISIGKEVNYTEFLPNAFITRWIPYTVIRIWADFISIDLYIAMRDIHIDGLRKAALAMELPSVAR